MRASRVRKPSRFSGTRSSGSASTRARARPSGVDLERLRRLRLVGMLRAGVDLELVDLLARQAVLREHPLDRRTEHFGRAALELLAERAASQAPRVAGMPVVALLVE